MKKVLLLFIATTMLVGCGSDEKEVSILDLSKQLIEVGSEGGDYDISLSCNEKWLASVSNDEDWVSISPNTGTGNSKLRLTVEQNLLMEERTTEIIVKSLSLEKKIEVTQLALALDDYVLRKWRIEEQKSGDANYDDLVGLVLKLNADKSAEAELNIEVPGVGYLDKITGTWSLVDNEIVINGTLLGQVPIALSVTVTDTSDSMMSCTFKANLPGMFPSEGIPVIFKAVE